MTSSALSTIPGGQSLIEWFGRVPHFHDAEVLDISIEAKTPSFVKTHAWVMTDKVDDRGYFVTERHAIVTISLDEVTYIALSNFNVLLASFSILRCRASKMDFRSFGLVPMASQGHCAQSGYVSILNQESPKARRAGSL
jgi:hypothetical protein